MKPVIDTFLDLFGITLAALLGTLTYKWLLVQDFSRDLDDSLVLFLVILFVTMISVLWVGSREVPQ